MNHRIPGAPLPMVLRSPARRMVLQRAAALGAGIGLGASLPACGGMSTEAPSSADSARIRAAAGALPAAARDLMQKTGVPGLSLAVVHRGETVLAEGYGVCRAGGSEAVNADTVFQLASVSKPLGATVVARQVGEGRVRWDSPMRELLPWFKLGNDDTNARLTVADLYAHRSGLPDHAGDDIEEMGWPQREVLERLRFQPLQPLGTHYAYTNAGLTAAALGVAARAGTDWATLSEQTLYAPLGMTRTTSRYADFMRQTNRAVGHVRGSTGWEPGAPRNADPQSAAGGASSSARDMARWLALLLARGRWEGRTLVGAEALQAAMSPQAPGGAYGYGFNVGTLGEGGLRMNSHSGAFQLGAATCFMLVPALDVAVVALTNSWPIGVPETLCRHFLDLAQSGRATRDWWTAYNQAISGLVDPVGSLVGKAPPANPAPPKALSGYAGRYSSDYFGELQVDVMAGNALRLSLGPLPQVYPLRHWSGDDFVFHPANESAAPGSISLARFDVTGRSVWLEFYDTSGLGRFVRV
ncbi:serine hydrolase [Ottowia sp. VDI28]|uniref:serine hydrolase n=1 Tax=Ottowia sp. VDI28 TaxID=3133968 RepID=UPI003C30AABF